MIATSSCRFLDCAGRRLDLDRPLLMGILNVTPDSFSDGGRFLDPAVAIAHAQRMVDEGADIVDVGGESTRPGAEPVSVEEELGRVLPVVEALTAALPVPVSVDTSKPAVMRAAAAAGAGMINDIYALRAPGAIEAAAETGLPVCLMHMLGEPRTMQNNPQYRDVVDEVGDFLAARVAACIAGGVAQRNIVIDPGFGFGKTAQHNYTLLHRLPDLAQVGLPLLAGVSRKSMIRAVLPAPVADQRLAGSVAAAVLAVWQGASIVRVHDVAATKAALAVTGAALMVRAGATL